MAGGSERDNVSRGAKALLLLGMAASSLAFSPPVAGLRASRAAVPRGCTRLGGLRMAGVEDRASKERKQRDETIGTLSASVFEDDTDALGFRSLESLAEELRVAREAADEAEERAVRMRQATGRVATSVPKSNGLSAMINPIALEMQRDRTEFLTSARCPIREFQENMEATKCGVMQAFAQLDPKALFALGISMYVLSITQFGGF